MFKRICVVVFAVSVFASSQVDAHHSTRTVPDWVVREFNEGNRCRRWEGLMRKHRLPVRAFSYICHRESRGNTFAHNEHDPHSGSYGLWQVNGSWTTVTSRVCKTPWGDMTALYRPSCNAAVAAYLYRDEGLAPWGF